jgi:branched-chain amino acid transport system ATP-binding protein
MNLLEVEHLVVEHGRLRALWDVNLAIGQGEQIGLLGANGAGKSTTLGAIIGLYPTVGGDIRFAGESILHKPISEIIARGVVLVPEGRHLFGEMTVRENLEMGAYLPRERKHVTERLEGVFDLFPVLRGKSSQPANTLSGGQQQMAAIGRALMLRPRLLLLDEPFIGVAPVVIDEVIAVLRRVAGEGMTILLVEQNIHRALDFVQAACVIENGRTVLAGTREELLADTGFGSKFLGLD